MALPKAVRYMFALLVICYHLVIVGKGDSLHLNLEIKAVALGDKDFKSATLLGFREGSVIALYGVTATSFQNSKRTALREKIFTKIQTDIGYTIPEDYVCRSVEFGDGKVGAEAKGCNDGEVGERIAVCKADGNWDLIQDTCILKDIDNLIDRSQDLQSLTEEEVSNFLGELSSVTENNTAEVVKSPANIGAIVGILNSVANTNISINKALMTDILKTVDILISDATRDSWKVLNDDATERKASDRINATAKPQSGSNLLNAIETITGNLTSDSFVIERSLITLNKTTFTYTYNNGLGLGNLNSSVDIDIPVSNIPHSAITTVIFVSMHNVLPARNTTNNDTNSTVISGNVVLVKTNATINNVSFTFHIFDETLGNETLGNPQCVFWNFSLFSGLGAWDSEGCVLVSHANGTVTCNCNHLTSFSILMSPFILFDKEFQNILDYITYIGVGISMCCLVICLIIETVVWRKIRRNTTSYLRHVSIVNISVSLLIADIWFIIGGAISDPETDNVPACNAATFFIHFFYLALFFWMLASALLLLYRTVFVLGEMTKKSMLAIAFSLGYGAPLIIAIITIAVTAPDKNYIRRNGVCWLSWDPSKALLAFVIPALMVVATNLLILIVVIYKMLRSRTVGESSRSEERHVLLTIARSLLVITPFFGTTWGLGVGTMVSPHNKGIHIVFAIFNSLQGCFILVFGTLLDKKIRSGIKREPFVSRSGSATRSIPETLSTRPGCFWNLRRDVHNVTSGETSTGASESFGNS